MHVAMPAVCCRRRLCRRRRHRHSLPAALCRSPGKPQLAMLERWNTHFSTTVEQELFGCVGLAGLLVSGRLGTHSRCASRLTHVHAPAAGSISSWRRTPTPPTWAPRSGMPVWSSPNTLRRQAILPLTSSRRKSCLCKSCVRGGAAQARHAHLLVSASLHVQNSRRGDFSRHKIRGKQALELGAGMGLAGMALALLGAGERQWLDNRSRMRMPDKPGGDGAGAARRKCGFPGPRALRPLAAGGT